MNEQFKKANGFSDKEYLASGEWKCHDSPTGAHRWDCNRQPSVCKVCGKVKEQLR